MKLPLALLLALAGCVSCSRSGGDLGFVEAPCAFKVPAGASVRCGWLSVHENRSLSHGRVIRLHVAVYKSDANPPAPDPIVWLVGGPGGRGHAISTVLFDRVVRPYLGHRDFIVLDVRGTGYSQPALDCQDRSGPPAEWIRGCRERLSRIADLACYNSAAVAADLADLRRALGYRQWNLLGESYGTRLALIAMRDRPEGIRSVVLDSVAPPEVDEYADGPAKFENAMNALFADHAAEFPNLRGTLIEAADQLDREPRVLSGVWHGTRYDFELDGRQLMEAMHMGLYESDLIPRLPQAIRDAAAGGGDQVWSEVIARHAIFVFRRGVDIGAHLSFHCTEEIPFADRARLAAEDAARPWMRHTASGLGFIDACRLWPAKRGDAREALPVESDIPVLLLAGEYDPVTPPSYARSAAAHLRNGHLFVFPGMGHWLTGTSVNPCPRNLVLEFLDHPERRPTAACSGAAAPEAGT